MIILGGEFINHEKKLLDQFETISKLGYVRSQYNGRGCIGRTFEYLVGLDGDSLADPDYHGIEIKTKTRNRSSYKRYITLFSCIPNSKKQAIASLCENYGFLNPESNLNEFNMGLYVGWKKPISEKYEVKLCLDLEKEKLFLFIYENGKFIDKSIAWDLEYIKFKLLHKLQKLCYVIADEKKIQGDSFYHYNEIHFYLLKSFDRFVYLLEHCKIKVSFKIGRFKTGTRKGEIYDHGTSFDLREDYIDYLFEEFHPE